MMNNSAYEVLDSYIELGNKINYIFLHIESLIIYGCIARLAKKVASLFKHHVKWSLFYLD